MNTGTDWTAHVRQAEDEDVAFLLSTGVQLPDACRRVGITVDAYERRQQPDRART